MSALSIVQLPHATLPLDGTEIMYGVQNGIDVQLTAGDVGGNIFGTQATVLTADFSNANASSPTGTMCGMGATFQITPLFNTRVYAIITGTIELNGSPAACLMTMSYGVGTPPNQGDPLVNVIQYTQVTAQTSLAGVFIVPYTMAATVTSLSPNTTYWFDVGLTGVGGGGTNFAPTNFTAFEI